MRFYLLQILHWVLIWQSCDLLTILRRKSYFNLNNLMQHSDWRCVNMSLIRHGGRCRLYSTCIYLFTCAFVNNGDNVWSQYCHREKLQSVVQGYIPLIWTDIIVRKDLPTIYEYESLNNQITRSIKQTTQRDELNGHYNPLVRITP